MSASFELSGADRLTVGVVGPPGQRIFFLQARQADQVVTLKLEKQQVQALSQLLDDLLSDLPAVGALPVEMDLEEPVLPEWVVGAIQIAYDSTADRVVMLIEEVETTDEAGDPAPSGGMARLAATREQAAALARRGHDLVTAGRPTCPLCGYPLDPSGHSCPRTNGHRPPTL